MARLLGPDEAVQTVYLSAGPNRGKAFAQGLQVPLYADVQLTTPADVIAVDGTTIAGSPPTVTVDGYSRIPLFQYPDGVDVVYTSISGGPVVALHASTDQRIDGLAAAVTVLQGQVGSGGSAGVSAINGRSGTVTLAAADVGLANVNNTADSAKPVSTAQAAALALKADATAVNTALAGKAPLASPTFTGTVSGVTAAMVGLGNVDNTADVNKPVSTAQAAADALKFDKSGGPVTGDLSVSGYTSLHGSQITGDLVVTGYTSLQGISLGGDLVAPNLRVSGYTQLDGNSSAPTAAPGTNTTQVATTAFTTLSVAAHTAASDPHGDRAAAASALTTHVGAADPHGDRAAAASALTTHIAASDPHGDRAVASAALTTHVAASDPHGDRAFATSGISTHAGAADPHGDRAFATSAVTAHAAATDPHGDRAYADTGLAAKTTGPASATDGLLALFNGTTGKVVKASAVGLDANADMTGLRRLTRTLSTDPAVAGLQRTDLTYAVSTSSSDLERVYVSSVLTSWRNEVGFLRGTPHSGYKDDAVVRGVPRSDLTSQTGGWLELQNNARTQVTYKRDWFGKLWRGDGTAAAIAMADTYVTTVGATLPTGLPPCVVVRI